MARAEPEPVRESGSGAHAGSKGRARPPREEPFVGNQRALL